MVGKTWRWGTGWLCLLAAWFSVAQARQPDSPARPPAAVAPQQRDARFLHARGIAPGSQQSGRALVQQKLLAERNRSPSVISASASHVASATASSSTWQAAGPVQLSTPAYGLVTGRVSSLIADPNDTSGNTLYLGATGGGVWKSTNAAGPPGSVSFTPMTDGIAAFANSFTSVPSLSIGALSVQPGNAQVVLAGTGDPNDALDSYYGEGILRSTNGGLTWTLIQSSRDGATSGYNYSWSGLGFAGFAWSGSTPNLVVAAVSQSLEGAIVNAGLVSMPMAGLYYSTDAGQTWHLATITDGANQVIQSPSKATPPPGNPATAVVWNAQRGLFLAAVRFHGYYGSPDGITWTRLAQQPGSGLTTQQCPARPSGTGSLSCPIFRGALAVQPVTGDTFAITTDINDTDQGLYQDVCSAGGLAASSCTSNTITFGTRINDTALDTAGAIPAGDYALALSAVSSQQDTILFAGTTDIYRCSLANSCTWRNTTNTQSCAAAQVAPYTHAIDGTYGANGLVYFANDGGLWRSIDTVGQTASVCDSSDASHFQNLNGALGSLSELTHIAVSASNPSLVLAGMGEFGIVASETQSAQSGQGSWQQLLTGEGSYVAIDPATPANWYADSGQGVAIFSCPDGGSCGASSFGPSPVVARTQVETDTDYFLDAAPWMLDPLNPSNIILGTCRMWLGPVTGGWQSSNLISGMLDNDQGSFCNGNAQLRAVGAGGSYNGSQGGEQMYAGMAGTYDGGGVVPGHLYGATVPQSGGTASWTDLWRNPVTNISSPYQFNSGGNAISSITVDPGDSSGKTLYVGISGFPTGQDGIVYRSTDGGAHWANITNSLPTAPVNAIVVDPSNSAIVYVGGDFGVYSTKNIASCSNSSQNCWGQLGQGLPNAPVTDLKAVASNGSTVLEAATYGRGLWTLGLFTSAASGQATLTPGSYSFPAQATGSTGSTVAGFTLKNSGSVALIIAEIATTADYAQTNNCGSTLAVGAACSIQVTFNPTTTGSRPGTLTVRANIAGGTITAALSGTGLTPAALSMSPASLTYPTTQTGASSASQNVTLTNTGGAPAQLGAPTLSGSDPGDFSLASGSSCGSSLAAGASCSIPIAFTPAQTGMRSAQLQIVASAPGSPFTIPLSGNAVAPAALVLNPTSLSFPSTAQGNTSSAQSITVTNTGGVAAQLGTAGVSGDYVLTSSTCGATLPPGSSCMVSIAFSPTSTGSRAGLFALPSSSIPAGQVTAPLSGSGLPPPNVVLSPASLSFPAQQQGTTSSAQLLTVSNTAGSPAQVGTPALTGDFALASSTCPGSLAVGSSCTLGITFTPSSTGTRNGLLSLPVNHTTSTAALSGTGTSPPILGFSPSSLSFDATAEQTTSASQQVAVTNNGGSPATIASIALTGPFMLAANTCPVAPQALAVGAACTLQIDFTPPAAAAYSGAATLTGNFGNAPATIHLSGQGAPPPEASLTPASLSFPDTRQGSVSAVQTLTVASTGGVAVQLGSPSVPADYQISANNCPASLAPGSSCTLSVLFHPAGVGARPGMLTQPGNMAGGPLTAALSGNGLAPGALTLSPASLDFQSQVIGTTSSSQAVTLTNSASTTVPVGSPAIMGDYLLTGSTCGATLDANQSCSLTLAFEPTTTGDRPGQLQVPGDDPGSPVVTTLGGSGAAPGQLSITPSSLAFGTVAIGSSVSSTVTVANNGGIPVTLSFIGAGSDFAVSGGTCATSAPIAPGGSCTVAVTFTPSTTGARSSNLTLVGNGSPSSVQAGLAGEGAVPGSISLSPGSVDFQSVLLATTAPAQTIMATNSGGVAVPLGPAVVSGSGYTLASSSCGSALAPGASCAMQITYTPVNAGPGSGLLTLPAGNSARTAGLSGTGVLPGALTLSPNPAVFGIVVVASTAVLAVTAQNTGGAAIDLGSPGASSGFAIVASQCGATLAPAAICTVQVSFTPAEQGTVAGLLTFPSSAPGGAATGALSGTGVTPGRLAVSPGSLTFAPALVGTASASQQVVLSNGGGSSIPLGAPSLPLKDYSLTSNTCTASLGPGGTCTLSINFTPSAGGDRSGTLTLASPSGNGQSVQVALHGAGLLPAHLVLLPASYTFSAQQVRTTSASQPFTVQNTGGVSTTLGLPMLAGPYAITANSCGTSLGAGATCQIAVQFIPLSSGDQSGALSIASIGGLLRASSTLAGTGAALALSPASVTFTPPLLVGATSAPVGIAVENLGTAPMQLNPIAIAGDFAISLSSCSATLPPDTSCVLFVTFTPTAGGTRTGVITVSTATETRSTTLSGTGLSPATDGLTPSALTFGATTIGQASSPLGVTLTNAGDATLSQISTKTTGPFTATNNCGASLAGHLSCVIAVRFVPTAPGNATGTLTLTDAQRSQIVTLNGSGIGPAQAFAYPGNIDFGPYAQGIATPPQTIVVSNRSASALQGVTLHLAGDDFAISSTSCGSTLAPGATCQVAMVFTPGVIGNREGTLTVTSPDLPAPLAVSLAGAGEDFQIAVVGSSQQVVTAGATAQYSLAITPIGASSGSLAFTCANVPANATCTPNPATVAISGGAQGSITVNIATATAAVAHAAGPNAAGSYASRSQAPLSDSASTSLFSPRARWLVGASALATLCPLFLSPRRSRLFFLLLAVCSLVLAPVGCGVHASGTNSSKGGGVPGQTASGSYPITIQASFPGAQRSVTVTLVVQ